MTWSKFEFRSSSSSCPKKKNKRINNFNSIPKENRSNSCNIMVDTRVRRGSNFASPILMTKEQKCRTIIQQKPAKEKIEKSNQSVR